MNDLGLNARSIFQILPHIRNHGPLSKPDGCPDWVYILMHQCWAYDSVQRPPALAIFDCLTSRYFLKLSLKWSKIAAMSTISY